MENIKQKRPRFNRNLSIVKLMDTPPIKSGTNRHRNMLAIMESATVGEAMEKLRAMSPAPGGGVDIKIALKYKAIKLET
tara:strand:- start:103 stop:339 length:237 start_codon:yes stop_codon:yes gene_type:complete